MRVFRRPASAQLPRAVAMVVIAALALTSGCSALRGDYEPTGSAAPIERADRQGIAAPGTDQPVDQTIRVESRAIAEPFDFTAVVLGADERVEGAQLYADAPLLVTFVVPACPVCIEEAPHLAATAERHPDIDHLIVHSFGSDRSYLDYVATGGLAGPNVTHVIDDDGALWRRFDITSQPTSVLVDAEGRMSKTSGALGVEGLERAVTILRG